MASILTLYISYLKAAVLVMVWAALTFAAYSFIRSSTVAEVFAALVIAPGLAWLHKPGSRSGRNQPI